MKRSNGFAVDPTWRAMLKDLGVLPADVLRRAGLPEDLFSHPDSYLSTEQFFALWHSLEQELNDPLFPIKLGQIAAGENFTPTIFAALCSSNLKTAAERLAKYKRLIAPMRLDLQEDKKSLTITFHWLDTQKKPPSSLIAAELIYFVQLARVATRHNIKPLHVMSAQKLLPAQGYEDYFGLRVRPGEGYSLSFSIMDAYRPFLSSNPSMWRVFEPDLRRRLSDLDGAASFQDRAHSALLEGLPSGEFAMHIIAGRLGVSKRTLQRRLKEEGTSFQVVLRNTRQELALHYLGQAGLSSSEIAFLLGFEETSSFFRAFHQWTGKTPEALRQDLILH